MRYLFLALASLFSASAASAQDIGAFGNWSVQAGLTNVMTSAVKSASKGNGRDKTSPALLTYQRDPEVSRKAELTLIGIVEKSSPAAVGQLKRTLRENDIIAMFDRDMRPFGLSSEDLADVFAAFIVANWMIANQTGIPEAKAVTAVRNNIATGMSEATGRLDPKQRQMIAEIVVYQTMFSIGARTAAGNDRAKMTALSDQAQQILLGFGVNARAHQLTDSGFTALSD